MLEEKDGGAYAHQHSYVATVATCCHWSCCRERFVISGFNDVFFMMGDDDDDWKLAAMAEVLGMFTLLPMGSAESSGPWLQEVRNLRD